MKYLKETFAQRIIIRRQELGVSRIELARRAGMRDQTIAYIETGDNLPSIETFARLCEVLDLYPGLFFDRLKSAVRSNRGPEPFRKTVD